MEGLSRSLLWDVIPKAGFIWNDQHGSPRVLSKDGHDANIKRAVLNLPYAVRFNRREFEEVLREVSGFSPWFLYRPFLESGY